MKLNIYSFEGVLINREWLSDLTYRLEVDISEFLEQNPDFNFKPGQWLAISLEKNNAKLTRAYSIANSPKQVLESKKLEFLIKVANDYGVSKKLSTISTGSKLWFKGAYGFFTLQDLHKPKLFIATGTGLAPIKSMVTSLYEKDLKAETSNSRSLLIYGCRTEKELYFKRFFEDLALKHNDFDYWYILSRPNDAWKGFHGHVQLLVDKALKEGVVNTNFDVYVCGSPKIVESIVDFCKEKGFRNLFFERY